MTEKWSYHNSVIWFRVSNPQKNKKRKVHIMKQNYLFTVLLLYLSGPYKLNFELLGVVRCNDQSVRVLYVSNWQTRVRIPFKRHFLLFIQLARSYKWRIWICNLLLATGDALCDLQKLQYGHLKRIWAWLSSLQYGC